MTSTTPNTNMPHANDSANINPAPAQHPPTQPPQYVEKHYGPQDPELPQNTPMPNKAMMDTIGRPGYVAPLDRLDKESEWIDCPHCQQRVKTRVEQDMSGGTIATGVLCACLCLCLACVPCLCKWFYTIDHFCTNCNKRVVHISTSGKATIYPVQPPQPRPANAPNNV